MVNPAPQQGDIIKVDLNPRKGHEQQGFRPVIVLSNDTVSKYANVVIVAPISTTKRRLPLYRDLPDSGVTKGAVLLDQLVTIDYTARSFQFVEKVPPDLLAELLDIARRIFTVTEKEGIKRR
ncbi:MAG: type II toxin-antitoxin system PemK/MazF family toxin [Spirochaetaceae bacterium]|jgi:mRNA interferase MazF|nr:type II toxin-antitoxin system PemK/MazF family toxin [Spirochaetaceae bacterium]